MSAFVLYLAVFIVGFAWLAAQADAAKKEFNESGTRRAWIFASFMFFATLVSVVVFVGGSGTLGNFQSTPPPFALFIVGLWAVAFFAAFSRFGDALVKQTPMWALVGFHAFRALAELVLFLAMREGLAPVQMTFEGYNFDIVTAVTALPFAAFVYHRPFTRWVWVWNVMGLCLLIAVMFIAATSMPAPFRLFMNEPSNVWVTRLPYALLPGILVTAAATGHLIIFRKINSRVFNRDLIAIP